jgi:rod shape-determining protein MreC
LLRNQLVLSICLVFISIILLLVSDQTSLNISARLSPFLLFPLRTASSYIQFLTVSRARINDLEIQISELGLENTRLRKKLQGDSVEMVPSAYRFITAHVVGRDPSDFNGFLYIDKGQKDSIYANQPAVIAGRLVGKIKQAGDNYSIIETIENKNIAISAFDGRSGINGIVRYHEGLYLDYAKINDDIVAGDSIYTSGMSESFPPGILIGSVARTYETGDLLFKCVELAPGIQINRLYYVHILAGSAKTIRTDQVINDVKPTSAPEPGSNP